ncbi:hypothetical protein QBC47DRAFT_185070 [Echria macrotheca]|uniref:Uncharacterized protein n=1 Tax=Echria macrotheca TaxID=438768 RepID=A0AAJ0FAI6_9PEZI|nr:hypothetical protein QBC47DRAFT_185070 [Echria macrotheca]
MPEASQSSSTVQPLAVVALDTSDLPAEQRRDLEIRRNGRLIEFVDTLTDHILALEFDRIAVVPLFAIGQDGKCDVQLACGGQKTATYRLRDRKAASRLLQVFTGFCLVDYFRPAACSIVYEGGFWIFGHNGALKGRGELHLFQHQSYRSTGTASVPVTASGSASYLAPETGAQRRDSGIPASYLAPQIGGVQRRDSGIPRRSSTFSIRSAPPVINEPIINSELPKPLLLALLEAEEDQHIMLQINILDLDLKKPKLVDERRLDLKPKGRVECLAVSGSELSKWDMGAMMRQDKPAGTKELKCSNLSLAFASAESRENFIKRIVYLQVKYYEAINQRFRPPGSLSPTPSSRSLLPRLDRTSDRAWQDFWQDLQAPTEEWGWVLDGDRSNLGSSYVTASSIGWSNVAAGGL